ncbi:MAG: CYTH domain-containing protein, partial [Trueperaceae bacterium]|nr:CYTH domain-containing protein [Trueperaceae bacterium]
MKTERERKYLRPAGDPPDRAALTEAWAPWGLEVGDAVHLEHRDRYYDDPRLSLQRAGFALRRRTGEGRVVATLKTLGTVQGAEHVRGELEVVLDADAPQGWPTGIADAVGTVTDPGALHVVMALDVVRTDRPVLRGGVRVATLSFDTVAARKPGQDRRVAWSEVELEWVEDVADDASEALAGGAGALAAAFGWTASDRTKLERAHA